MSYFPLVGYTLLVLLASLLGGVMPLLIQLNHKSMQFAISFVAGVMLGAGLLHMLPHAVQALDDVQFAMIWVLLGFLLTFFVQRFLLIHHHAVPHDHAHDPELAHGHEQEHNAAQDHECSHAAHAAHADEATALECGDRDLVTERFTWTGAALGLAIHSLISGIALAAAFEAKRGRAWAGGATFLAIFIHKPFDSLTIVTLMRAGKWAPRTCHLVNALFSLAIPLGVLLFYLGLQNFSSLENQILGIALAASAGTFLCISASDLLPEMQLHSHDRGELSLWLILGITLAYLVEFWSN